MVSEAWRTPGLRPPVVRRFGHDRACAPRCRDRCAPPLTRVRREGRPHPRIQACEPPAVLAAPNVSLHWPRGRATRHYERMADPLVSDSGAAPSGVSGWRRRWVAAVALLLVAVGLPMLAGQPQRLVRCTWERRDGWTVEHPQSSVTEREFRQTVQKQTECVGLTVHRVNTNAAPEGFVVRPIGAKTWVPHGGSIEVLVEADAGEGVIECGEAIGGAGRGQATEVLACPTHVNEPPS